MEAHQYGLFQDDREGAMWREDFADLNTAKAEVQRLAEIEKVDFFIYCSKTQMEVARIAPSLDSSTQT